MQNFDHPEPFVDSLLHSAPRWGIKKCNKSWAINFKQIGQPEFPVIFISCNLYKFASNSVEVTHHVWDFVYKKVQQSYWLLAVS